MYFILHIETKTFPCFKQQIEKLENVKIMHAKIDEKAEKAQIVYIMKSHPFFNCLFYYLLQNTDTSRYPILTAVSLTFTKSITNYTKKLSKKMEVQTFLEKKNIESHLT